MSSLRPYISLDGGYFPFETQNTFSSPVRNTGQIITVILFFIFFIADIICIWYWWYNEILYLQQCQENSHVTAVAALGSKQRSTSWSYLCVKSFFKLLSSLCNTDVPDFAPPHIHFLCTPLASLRYRSPKPCICAYIAHIQGQ